MPRTVEMVLGIVVVVVLALGWLARRFPDIAWLHAFRWHAPKMSEAQRVKRRRRATIYAGAELILMGLVLPLGYVALIVMLFSRFTPAGIAIVTAASLLCVGLGITAIWRAGRD